LCELWLSHPYVEYQRPPEGMWGWYQPTVTRIQPTVIRTQSTVTSTRDQPWPTSFCRYPIKVMQCCLLLYIGLLNKCTYTCTSVDDMKSIFSQKNKMYLLFLQWKKRNQEVLIRWTMYNTTNYNFSGELQIWSVESRRLIRTLS